MCLRLQESIYMYRSFPNAFSLLPGIVSVRISPGTTCLKHFIAPAQLKVVGVEYDPPRAAELYHAREHVAAVCGAWR